jgi:hypothetical protein
VSAVHILTLHYVAVKKNTSAKSVKEFISGHSAFIFDFDATDVRDLHIFLLYVIFTNIGTDQVIHRVGAYQNYTYVYTGKLNGILKVNKVWEILYIAKGCVGYSVIEFEHEPFYSIYLYFLRCADFLKSNLRQKYTYTSKLTCWCKCPMQKKTLIYLQNSETFKNPSIHPPTHLSVSILSVFQ